MTSDELNAHIANNRIREDLRYVPRLRCADGFTMSVQASRYHYCAPREDAGPYIQVEIGFPSQRVEEFMPFIDGDETTDPLDTVYGYVPISIVADVISAHGGLAAELAAPKGAA